MNLQRILIPLGSVVGLLAAYQGWGWPGVALAAGALLMWLLLHFTRVMQVLRRASQRPIGHVDSAVMLNARLKPGMTLLHVLAMTRALGQLQTQPDAQAELYRWSDASDSYVEAEFRAGTLRHWSLIRPPQPPSDGPAAAPAVTPGQPGPVEPAAAPNRAP